MHVVAKIFVSCFSSLALWSSVPLESPSLFKISTFPEQYTYLWLILLLPHGMKRSLYFSLPTCFLNQNSHGLGCFMRNFSLHSGEQEQQIEGWDTAGLPQFQGYSEELWTITTFWSPHPSQLGFSLSRNSPRQSCY